MELKNLLTPWNWFKKEEEQTLPVRRHNVLKEQDNPFVQLHREVDKLFDSFFAGFPLSPFRRDMNGWLNGWVTPHVDISEGKNDYTITVEVPGVDEKDLELTLADGTLLVRGEKRYEKENSDRHYHRVERSYGSFQRMLSLPPDADEEKIDAKFKNGVLTITVARNPEAKSGMRKIAIH